MDIRFYINRFYIKTKISSWVDMLKVNSDSKLI